jgi:cystathionine beta-lyase/cystathionine gamma-synthase
MKNGEMGSDLGNPEVQETMLGVSGTYKTVEEWRDAFASSMNGKPVKIYDRYNYPELVEREEKVAKLTGAKEVLLYNDGMAAITSALDSLFLDSGDIVLYSPAVYGKSAEYIDGLQHRGVKCIQVNTGDAMALEKSVRQYKPKAIFTETVGNAPDMPVVDLENLFVVVEDENKKSVGTRTFNDALRHRLNHKKWMTDWTESNNEEKISDLIAEFEKTGRAINNNHSLLPVRNLFRFLEKEGLHISSDTHLSILEILSVINSAWLAKRESLTTIILDNTIPTETGLELPDKIEETRIPVLVAESGTKFYAQDATTMGIIYSNSPELIANLRIQRATNGSYFPKGSELLVPDQSKEEFDTRNANILHNTKLIAEAFASIVGTTGIKAVSYPNLPTHPNYEYASKNMPEGASGLFYLVCDNAFETAKQLEEAGLAGRIEYGPSFGLEKTRFAIFTDDKILRIAGGNESPEDLLKILEIIEKLK